MYRWRNRERTGSEEGLSWWFSQKCSENSNLESCNLVWSWSEVLSFLYSRVLSLLFIFCSTLSGAIALSPPYRSILARVISIVHHINIVYNIIYNIVYNIVGNILYKIVYNITSYTIWYKRSHTTITTSYATSYMTSYTRSYATSYATFYTTSYKNNIVYNIV